MHAIAARWRKMIWRRAMRRYGRVLLRRALMRVAQQCAFIVRDARAVDGAVAGMRHTLMSLLILRVTYSVMLRDIILHTPHAADYCR